VSIDIFPPVSPPGYSTIPSGVICDFGGATAPSGWLVCDGTAVSRTAYAALFAAIGTTYGTGDSSTTFNLPDLRTRVAVGVGTGRALASVGGSADAVVPTHSHSVRSATQTTDYANVDHSHTLNEHYHATSGGTAAANTGSAGFLPQQPGGGSAAAFNGTFNSHGHTLSLNSGGAGWTGGGANLTTNGFNTNHYHSVTVDAAGVAVANVNMPPYLTLNKIIKV